MIYRHLPLVFFVNATWVALSMHFEAYRWYERIRIELQLGKILKILVFHLAFITVFYYQILYDAPTSGYLWLTYAIAFLAINTGRIIHHLRVRGRSASFKYIVVGGEEVNIKALIEAFEHSFPKNATMVGRFGRSVYEGINNIGGYQDIKPYLAGRPDIQKVIMFYSRLSLESKREILKMCEAQFIDVEIAPREVSIFPRGYKGHQHGDMFIMTLKQEPLSMLRNKVVKRAFDIFFSLLVIVFILSWLIPIIGILIKIKDPGPVFFVQERSGYHNEVFKVIKFRTMRVNSDSNLVQAQKGDERVFKLGEFLRAKSIDEMPQFINVLFGTMSVVGPRPHMLKHTEQYAALIEQYMIRHKIKPGITGWAQVNGYRGPTEELWKMKKRVEYDVRYLENWSLPLDIRCILYTVFNVAKGEENAV